MSLGLIHTNIHLMSHDFSSLLPDSIDDVISAVEGFSGSGSVESLPKPDRQKWIQELLSKLDYERLHRENKGSVRQYIQNETGYSRAQTARLIKSSLERIAADKLLEAAEGEKDLSSKEATALAVRRHVTLLHRSATVGIVAFLLFVFAGDALSTKSGLAFLNAERRGHAPHIATTVGADTLLDEHTSDVVPVRSKVQVLYESVEYPLFVQQEELSFARGIAVAYEKTVADTMDELQKRAHDRAQSRALHGRLRQSVIDPVVQKLQQVGYVQSQPKSAEEQESTAGAIPVVEQIRGRSVTKTSSGDAPVPKSVHAQETRSTLFSSLFKNMAERRAERLARVPENERVVEAESPTFAAGALFAAAPSMFDAIGGGQNGQVLMMVDGQPSWTFINNTNVQKPAPHGGYASRRRGGAGRGG